MVIKTKYLYLNCHLVILGQVLLASMESVSTSSVADLDGSYLRTMVDFLQIYYIGLVFFITSCPYFSVPA